MNKKIVLAALILTASLALTGCELFDSTAENDPPSSQTTDEQTTTDTSDDAEITSDDPEITSTTPDIEVTADNSSAAGGNPDIAAYIEVTVSEDKYFYENHEISFDDLMEVLDGLDGNTAVRISDENAALKAYESLTKALEEREILFETVN